VPPRLPITPVACRSPRGRPVSRWARADGSHGRVYALHRRPESHDRQSFPRCSWIQKIRVGPIRREFDMGYKEAMEAFEEA